MASAFNPVFRPNGIVQNVTTSGTAANSNAVSFGCMQIRVLATTATWITISNTASVKTATASNAIYIPAATPEYFKVCVGDVISALEVASAGSLNIAEMSG